MTNPYSQYLIEASSIASKQAGAASSKILTQDSDFSDAFGFTRIGAHHLILPPGFRTSLPHAESHEEEFVFVVKGAPHSWIDGYIYELKPNVACGFPAGTGVSHCFINNTDSPVELLVFGERTRGDNRCAFPLNEEEKRTNSIWWADAPKHELGPHDGLPGTVKQCELGADWPSCLIDCEKLNLSSDWHYAGDSETFGDYIRLTDLLGLKFLGIGFECLRPGKRSAFPHAHKEEEEFLFTLVGEATIWMNGFTENVPPGTGVGFVPGTDIAHVIINNSQQTICYLVVGEATDTPHDLIHYPTHEFRNAQCRFKGKFWSVRPSGLPFGEHNGQPDDGLGDHLEIRNFDSSERLNVLRIFEQCPRYFLKVNGSLPTLKTVDSEVRQLPKIQGPHYKKEFLLLFHCDQSIGVVDLHINHPKQSTAYIGLFLLTEVSFGKRLGSRLYSIIEHYCKNQYEIELLQLGISDDNDVSAFWKKQGFSPNGKNYEWPGEEKVTLVREYEKQI